MQEFLSGDMFEKMAREYNAKYNTAGVLANTEENVQENLNQKINDEKEKLKFEIKKDFEDLHSLFLFTRKYIKNAGIMMFNKWGNFYFNKLNEIERKAEDLKNKVDEILM